MAECAGAEAPILGITNLEDQFHVARIPETGRGSPLKRFAKRRPA